MTQGASTIILVLIAWTAVHGHTLSNTLYSRQKELEETWSNELGPVNPETKVVEYKSPIKRVVNLLHKMKKELEAEAQNESEMYDKMVCWCETNEKEKKKAIADANAKDELLGEEIQARAARYGELTTKIEQLKEQIAEDTEALKKATAIRESEAAEFRGAERDLVQYVTNLKNAIEVLKKHHSFLQTDASLLTGLRVLLRDAALQYEMLMAGRSEKSTKTLKTAFLSVGTSESHSETEDLLLSALNTRGPKVPELPSEFAARVLENSAKAARSTGFLQSDKQPIFKSYSSRSSQIFGIMTQMLEEFEADLSQEQKDELAAREAYQKLSKAKTKQIASGKAKLDDLEEESAANEKALGDAKEDIELTRKQRSADVEFLRNLKLQCNDLDHEWQKRSKTRSDEITAVHEAIAILTSDDNREMLHKSVTLLQAGTQTTSSSSMRARRANAVEVLHQAAQAPAFDADDLLADWHSRSSPQVGARSQLSMLAMSVQLDSFTKVKEMMDKMVAELKKQQEEEVQFKASCVGRIDENDKSLHLKNRAREDLEIKMDQLAALKKRLQEEIDEAKKQITDTNTAIQKAGQDREKENADFQTTVADQRATQTILKKALLRLQQFYKKGANKSLLQRGTQTPPVQFNKYKNNAGASPVMGLIEQIIEESVALEKEATTAEYQAQADYENFVKDSNALIKGLSEAVTAKGKQMAAADLDFAEANSEHESTVDEIEGLETTKTDLHNQCDWLMKNFEARQTARLQEMEAIQQAKAILSGAIAK